MNRKENNLIWETYVNPPDETLKATKAALYNLYKSETGLDDKAMQIIFADVINAQDQNSVKRALLGLGFDGKHEAPTADMYIKDAMKYISMHN